MKCEKRLFGNEKSPGTTRKNPGLRFAPSGLRVLFLLERDTLLADVDVDAGRLLALLLELIAEHDDGDDQRAEDQEQNAVAGHGLPRSTSPSAGEPAPD